MIKKKNPSKAKTKTSHLDQYELPERIIYLRELRKMTQQDLAAKAKISQSTVAHIEGGKKDPSLTTLKKIAAALEIHLAVLFASDSVHVFDLIRLRKEYDHVDKLNPTLYFALGKIVQYAREIEFIK